MRSSTYIVCEARHMCVRGQSLKSRIRAQSRDRTPSAWGIVAVHVGEKRRAPARWQTSAPMAARTLRVLFKLPCNLFQILKTHARLPSPQLISSVQHPDPPAFYQTSAPKTHFSRFLLPLQSNLLHSRKLLPRSLCHRYQYTALLSIPRSCLRMLARGGAIIAQKKLHGTPNTQTITKPAILGLPV